MSSREYDKVHRGNPTAMVGDSLDVRVEQEAYFIHSNPLRDSIKYRINQRHDWTDWLVARSIIMGRRELVVPFC